MRLLVIDNYDSFTWNLVHLFGGCGAMVEVRRNDEISLAAALDGWANAILLSPGPGAPRDAGITCDLIRAAAGRVPLFGVCLGLQAIGEVMGGRAVRAPQPRHGKVSLIHHEGRGLFHGVNRPFEATRYHSLVVERATCPPDLEITAESEDGLIMGLSHRRWPVHGVQFHPESIRSEHGETIARRFLQLAGEWNARGA